VARLAAELEAAFGAEPGAAAAGARAAVEAAARRRARRESARRRAEERVRFWRARCVRRWWGAFGAVVADGQFAPLGLVLLGVLGEVCALVGVSEALGVEGGDGEIVEEEEVVVEEGEDVGVRVKREDSPVRHGPDESTVHLEDDRTQMDDTELPVEGTRKRAEDTTELRERPLKKPKTTKKRKVNDAMDELFSGLL